MFDTITRTILNFIPENLQYGVGDVLYKKNLEFATVAFGAKEQKIRLSNGMTHYLELGSRTKPAFLLLPGFSDIKETYLILGKLLEKDFRILVVDVPGFGNSESLSGKRNIQKFANWLEEFVSAISLEKFHVYGNSLGGAILSEFAEKNQERFLSVTLSCSAGIWNPGEEGFYEDYRKGRNIFLIETEDHLEHFLNRLFHRQMYIPHLVKSHLLLRYKKNKEQYSSLMDELMEDFIFQKGYDKLPDRYRHLKARTLVVWGEHDSLFPLSAGKILASYIPSSKFVSIPRTGHLPHMESPRKLAKVLEEFAKGH